MIGTKHFDFSSVLEAVCAPLRENENRSRQNTNGKHLNLRISSKLKVATVGSTSVLWLKNVSSDWKQDNKLTPNH